MVKVENGIIDEEEIAAVIQGTRNAELLFKSGQRLTISQTDAAALVGQLAPPPKK